MSKETDIRYATPSQPRQLRLDTTTSCTAHCLSCHRYSSKRSGEMDLGFMTEILRDVAKWDKPLDELVPVNYGDLFTRQDWFEILSTCSKILPSTPITLVTNGALLEESKAMKLTSVPTVRIINFSINAYFEETYKKFMGLDASNIDHIKRLVVAIRLLRPDIRIRLSMVFDPRYQTDLERDMFTQLWSTFGEIGIMPAASAGRKDNMPYYARKLPCRSIFSDVVVGFDGKLSSCCFDAGFTIDCGKYTGDLKKNWQNDHLTNLRRIHNEHKRDTIGLCKVCSFA